MLVLALDTTTRLGSCAIARDGVLVREHASDASQPPAARLPRDLMTLLADAGIDLHDVDVFAVATGPGSFTGLRIGIAAMQGLAFSTRKPLIGVSGLDALALSARAPRVATWVDAWRGEVYAATYEHGRPIDEPVVGRPEDLLRAVLAPTCFVGDGAETYRAHIHAALGPLASMADPVTPLLAGTIARRATDAAHDGALPPPDAIRPLYVRRPDAELVREARHGG